MCYTTRDMHTNIPLYRKNFPDKNTFCDFLSDSNNPNKALSSGLCICKRSFLAIWVYIMVVSGFECPNNP